MGLIDAAKAMKAIDEIACSMNACINSDYYYGMTAMQDAAMHAIENQPTVDAVTVVRCKYCKHRFTKDCAMRFDYAPFNDDWFCAGGDRR